MGLVEKLGSEQRYVLGLLVQQTDHEGAHQMSYLRVALEVVDLRLGDFALDFLIEGL